MAGKTPQILQLDPPVELEFRGPFTEVVTTKLKLSNPTNERVVFKVKTTAPKQYCVRPNSGLIEPHKSQEVSVMLQPMDTVPVADRAKHKFMVQSLCVADNFIPEDLDATMRQADKTKLMDSKLKCLFIDNPGGAQPSPPSTSDKPSDSESSSVVTHMMDDVSVTPEENPHASKSQPTAGSTPSVSGRQNEMEADMQSSEMRVLQDKAKKLAEENKTLKAETDRLRQQFLTQSTTTKAPLRPRSNKTESSSLNLIAVLLIIVALVMGYFVGTYTS